MGRQLTLKYLQSVLNYDPLTGQFTWRIDIPKRIKAGMKAGTIVDGKVQIGINGSNHYAHRLAWFYVHGEMPDGHVVAKNGNFLDCWIDNLQVETPAERARRSNVRKTSSSGVKGVSWNTRRNKWTASITQNYRQRNLGYFDTIEEAKAAYDEAALSDVPPTTIDIQKKRNDVAITARQRRAWHRVVDANGNSAWPSFDAFVKDIGSPPRDGSIIVPIDASMPIGPGNFTWARRAKYDKTNRNGRLQYLRDHRSQNFNLHRAGGLRRSFGLELHEYQEMHDRQNGLCAICGEPECGTRGGQVINLAVDHNHTTGAIRGLLCRGCNQGIGNFREDLDRLRKAVAYLEHHAELEIESNSTRKET